MFYRNIYTYGLEILAKYMADKRGPSFCICSRNVFTLQCLARFPTTHTNRERERERKRQRQRKRKIERETDRETERQRQRDRERERVYPFCIEFTTFPSSGCIFSLSVIAMFTPLFFQDYLQHTLEAKYLAGQREYQLLSQGLPYIDFTAMRLVGSGKNYTKILRRPLLVTSSDVQNKKRYSHAHY